MKPSLIKKSRIALITGGTGALGVETSKQLAKKGYSIILTGKNIEKLKNVSDILKKENHKIYPFPLDVSSENDIDKVYDYIMDSFGRLDILINNAAIYLDKKTNGSYPNFFDLTFNDLKETIDINFYAPFNLSRKFLPVMISKNFGRIVNVSSGMARFEDLDARGPFYRMSKVALNSLTCILAQLCSGRDICVNSVCPGWVRSNMGGRDAVRSASEGAKGIVWAATLPKGGPSGKFFRDQEHLDWCLKLGDPY